VFFLDIRSYVTNFSNIHSRVELSLFAVLFYLSGEITSLEIVLILVKVGSIRSKFFSPYIFFLSQDVSDCFIELLQDVVVHNFGRMVYLFSISGRVRLLY